MSLLLQAYSFNQIAINYSLHTKIVFLLPAQYNYGLLSASFIRSINLHKKSLLNENNNKSEIIAQWRSSTEEYISRSSITDNFDTELLTTGKYPDLMERIINVEHKDLCSVTNNIPVQRIEECHNILN